jgi:hypothetical protein
MDQPTPLETLNSNLEYQELSCALKEDCDRSAFGAATRSESPGSKKYMCCKVIQKIYKLLNKPPFNPEKIFLSYGKLPKFAENIPKNVKEYIDEKADSPQYIRAAIRNNHESCLHELLRFTFEPSLSIKTCIRYERFNFLLLFHKQWEEDRGWCGNYINVHSIEHFDMETDDTFTDTIIDSSVYDGKQIHELSYAVLCGSHKVLPILLNFHARENDDCSVEEEDEGNPLHLAIIKNDVYSVILFAEQGYSIHKKYIKDYMKTCSPEEKNNIIFVLNKFNKNL